MGNHLKGVFHRGAPCSSVAWLGAEKGFLIPSVVPLTFSSKKKTKD